ncbi:MAG TPA: patatin-like phospholipase family protein, partial [Polyangia bacterium]|nr:patatin-like phospholipase family protein [Polyangia bacterium]
MKETTRPARRRALGWMAGAAALLRMGRARARSRGGEDAGVGAGASPDARVTPAAQPSDPRAIVPSRPGALDVVFEGGGMKGAAFAGAMEILLGRGFRLRRLIGSSAGAITAAFLAAGYGAPELATALGERIPGSPKRRFSAFLDPPSMIPPPPNVSPLKWSVFALAVVKAFESGSRLGMPVPPEVLTSFARRGLFLFSTGAVADDGAFLTWLADALERKGISPDATLGQLQKSFGARGLQLSLAATDVSAQRLLILNH